MLLAALLEMRGEALEADFDRLYPLGLEALWTGELSVRKASVWATHLPPDAAVYRVGPDDHVWSGVRQELLSLRDDVRTAWFKDSKPLPRPGDEDRRATAEDAMFAKAEAYRHRQRNKGVAPDGG